jgi:hypothetical protein
MTFFKVLVIFLISASIVCGTKDRASTNTSLPVDNVELTVDLPVNGGPCATNPCLNDGQCVPASKTLSGFFCRCSIGFYGDTCTETNVELTLELINLGNKDNEILLPTFEAVAQVDPICVANPCQNTGRCIPNRNIDTGYVCLCAMGWTGQNCEEKEEGLTRHLRVKPSEEDNVESRSLQSGDTQWVCIKNGYALTAVSIWWGHTSGDGQWACNAWYSYCDGKCTASQQKINKSFWYCYGLDPMIYLGTTTVSWGSNSKGDATWACNNWIDSCKQYGGCVAKNAWYFDGLSRYNTYVKCSGNGGACTVLPTSKTMKTPITLNRFNADGTDEQVWGCGGEFKLTGMELRGTLQNETSLEIGLSFTQTDSFLGWEGCCAAAGEAMQSRGYLSDGWYCEKIHLTGIWLKGKAHWL